MKRNFKDNLFIMLILSAIFSYILQAVYAVFNRGYILWTMSNFSHNFGLIGMVFKYLKDIIAILLLIHLFMKSKNARKIMMYFIIIILFSSIILFSNPYFDFLYILAGIRMLLYIFVTIMYCKSENSILNSPQILKVIKMATIIEFVIVFSQIIFSGNITNIGKNAYRFCGTFGNAAIFGYFSVAASLSILYLPLLQYNQKNYRLKDLIFLIILLLLAITTGSRATLITNAIIIFIFTINFLQERKFFTKKVLFILIPVISIIIFPVFYRYLINLIGRGNIMISGQTRIDIFRRFFQDHNIKKIIFGYGIGYGTNIAYTLGLKTSIMADSTIGTIIYQYGVVGIIVLIICFLKVIQKFRRKCKQFKILYLTMPFILTIIIISNAGNIFEQCIFIIILCYIYYAYINNNTVNKNEKNYEGGSDENTNLYCRK